MTISTSFKTVFHFDYMRSVKGLIHECLTILSTSEEFIRKKTAPAPSNLSTHVTRFNSSNFLLTYSARFVVTSSFNKVTLRAKPQSSNAFSKQSYVSLAWIFYYVNRSLDLLAQRLFHEPCFRFLFSYSRLV